MPNRVVITGMGAITPLGNSVECFWNGLVQGKNGIEKIDRFDVEEYSTFYATNKDGQILFEQLEKEVVIAGIASEYCVLETTKELIKAGHTVTVLKDGLGYVDEETHQKALQEYESLGVQWA